jgi:thiamine biosynthesis lipoprotein
MRHLLEARDLKVSDLLGWRTKMFSAGLIVDRYRTATGGRHPGARAAQSWLWRAGAIAFLVSLARPTLVQPAAAAGELSRFRYSQNHMGTTVELILYAADERSANLAAAAAYARIRQLDGIMSDYQPESELSRLSRTSGSGQAVPISADLWVVLRAAQNLAERSGGAFDITVGPYVKLWRRARREKQLPSDERLREAAASVGYRHLELDDEHRTARLLKPGMRLDLGGIAMGYAVDEMYQVLAEQGISRGLIDGSGDILAGDPPPGADGWRIGIAPLEARDGPPSRFVRLSHRAVTTSGDAWQFVELAGRRYSHIVDPRTGLGLSTRSSVTILADDCLTADSLATAVCVLGPQAGLALVEQTPGAAAFIALMEDGQLKTYRSRRLATDEAK